jgi:hypothetical protein
MIDPIPFKIRPTDELISQHKFEKALKEFSECWDRNVYHGVVDLAEEQARQPIIITEDQAKIQSLEQRVQDLEDARWKQSSLLAMTQLVAVIALSIAVLALILT